MTREYIATAATVDEAIEIACKELGVSVNDCIPEILQLPKKGFFKKTPAKVRVTVEDEEVSAPVKEEKPAPKPREERPAPRPAKKAEPEKKAEAKPQPAPKAAQPAPKAPAAEVTKPAEKAPAKAAPAPQAPAQAPEAEEPAQDLQPKIDAAREYILSIFEKMGITGIAAEFEEAENRTVLIHLSGEGIGTVIGKRGETLDAIQYLVSLAANRLEGDYVRFTINAGNYREKREETLKSLAQRMAKKALKTGRPVALEPMNPYERRIIHAVVTDIEGVYSKSTGEEPNRKVVIKPSGRSGGYNRGRGEGRNSSRPGKNPRPRYDSRRPAAEQPAEGQAPVTEERPQPAQAPAPSPAPARQEAKKLDDNVKLYSKIEL